MLKLNRKKFVRKYRRQKTYCDNRFYIKVDRTILYMKLLLMN